ncbi:MAG TPA: hypothetical protein VJL88_00580 [Nitrospira sp.]|nr:hypothetical protein [Nitrospira sp.]
MTTAEVHKLSKTLLRLHKALLDAERVAYEQRHGRIASNGEYLQLVLGHSDFAWIRQLSRLMAELDDLADHEDAGTDAIAELLTSLRTLLTPVEGDKGFGRRYQEVLQHDPEVVLAHAAVKNLLGG